LNLRKSATPDLNPSRGEFELIFQTSNIKKVDVRFSVFLNRVHCGSEFDLSRTMFSYNFLKDHWASNASIITKEFYLNLASCLCFPDFDSAS
jgi:hypothetical protein